ncbi:MAG: polysaccharide biosynthesis/export family protein [Fuerstiella sp.]|nr:polysaccharide biosynthesis/export family protein [Fuerstiella sp.]
MSLRDIGGIKGLAGQVSRERVLMGDMSAGVAVMAVTVACLLLTGCAHNTYSVSSMPKQYAARPVSDYSSLNLTAYTRPTPNPNKIREGDRLEVSLHSGFGNSDAIEKWPVGVNDDGIATLPNIGPVRLVGLTRAQAEQTIVNESIARDVYLTPAVDLKLEGRRINSVAVTGGIGVPGTLEFPESSLTLADVIVRSGGLTKAATGQVIVNLAESHWDRGDQLTTVSQTENVGDSIRVDLATTSAAELAATQVPPGATITFEQVPERIIHVIGVIADRELEIPPGRNIRLLDALALAGGPAYSTWIANRVDIIRRVPGKDETIRIRASIRQAKKRDEQNLLLAPHDIVSVEENIATFALSALGGLAGLSTAARTATLP